MINRDPEGQIKNIKHTHIFYIVGMFYLMNLVAVIFARRLKWLGRINFNGKSQFLIWPRWKDLSLYFWYDNIITKTLTDCILDSLKPFEETGNVTRLRKGAETIKRCVYTLLNSFGWFVCVRVKTFNFKFVRDISLKFPFCTAFVWFWYRAILVPSN